MNNISQLQTDGLNKFSPVEVSGVQAAPEGHAVAQVRALPAMPKIPSRKFFRH